MDEMKETEQATPVEKTTQPSPKHTGGFFALFGKIMLFVLLAGILVFGGYYFGTKGMKKADIAISPTPIQSVMKKADETPTEAVVPTSAPKKTVKAGPASGTSFKGYSVEIPAGWTDTHETTAVSAKLTITKNDYTVTIYQAAIGGGGCVYKGDPPAQMAQQFTDFAAISGQAAQFRRSWNADGGAKITYTICQKNTSDSSYGSPTQFGAVSASAPNPSDAATLAELDGIIASLSN